ncbi:hypothetical protein ES707_01048 [subsurface metagenome]
MGAWFRWIRKLYNATFSGAVRYAVYPAIDAADISLPGVKLTAKTAKKMDADALAIVDAATSPQVEYWICSVLMHTIEVAEVNALELQNAAAAKLVDLFINPTALTLNLPQLLDLPFPIKMNAKAVVNGILGNVTGGKTAYVALLCATAL